MSKIQDVPFITKVIDTLSDELKSGLYDLIDGKEKTPIFRSLVNNDYAITEANDKGKVQFVTLETLRGNYTGYLAYNSVYCVLIAFKGNTQALDMLNINVAKHTFAFVNEALSILELRVELEDGKKGATPTDLGATNNNIHLAKGTTQIGEGVNVKTINGETLLGSGNIVVGEGGTIAIDTALSDSSTNAVQNKVVTSALGTKLALPATAPATRKVVTINANGTQDNVDSTKLTTLMSNIVDSQGHKRFIEGDMQYLPPNSSASQPESITITYAKWSLSGSHFMMVLCGSIAKNVESTSQLSYFTKNLPKWVSDKIRLLHGKGKIIGSAIMFIFDRANPDEPVYRESIVVPIHKWGAVGFYAYTNFKTFDYDGLFRVQFDLLIDSD